MHASKRWFVFLRTMRTDMRLHALMTQDLASTCQSLSPEKT